MGYLRRELAERAALSKLVRIVEEMPLTPVGKISERALRRIETKDAVETALREAGLPFRALEIVDDAARGPAARLELDDAAWREAARRVLGRFPFPFTISPSASSP